RARRRELHARFLCQLHDLLRAAIEHFERNEVTALGSSPARHARSAELLLERLQYLFELRRHDLAMTIHQRSHAAVAVEQTNVTQLIHLVAADGLNAHVLQVPGHVVLGTGEQGDTRARESDLGRRAEDESAIRIAMAHAQLIDVGY